MPGVPHLVTEEDVYKGFRIPKNSMVVANSWLVCPACESNWLMIFLLLQNRSMLHDEEVYRDPSVFRPERFLTEGGKLDPEIQDPATIAFGFGRRLDTACHPVFRA